MKMTLFKKIFLTIFVGLFIVETINVYFDYETNCRTIVDHYINRDVANKLSAIGDKYFDGLGQDKAALSDFIEDVKENLKDYKGYYAFIDDDQNIIEEKMDNPNFKIHPYMYLISKECFEKNTYCDLMPLYLYLNHIPKSTMDEMETYMHNQKRDHTFTIQYCGEQKEIQDYETNSMVQVVEPTYLQVDDRVIYGTEEKDMKSSGLYIYQSPNFFYRDYMNEDNSAYCYSREDLLKSSRSVALRLEDNFGAIGATRIGYEKQANDLMISQSIYTNKLDDVNLHFVCVDYYPKAFSYAMRDAIQSNMKVYFFTLALSCLMSLGISYTITRRIRKIEKNTREIADNHFDIQLKERPHDELGTLSHSINEMSSKLKITIDKLNEEIENVKKLETLRKEFIANFTHEIKTPLGIIDGYIELIEAIDDEEKKKLYLEAISQETARINELVLAMLNLSRLESGKIDLDIQEVDLEDFVVSTIDTYAGLLEKKNIRVELSGEETIIQCDPVQLQVVIKNFMSNAIKHTPEGMKIYVHYDSQMLSIENEGSHIDEEKMSHIWETYVSSDREGTGLGLAICKTILDMHGFSYKVENTKRGVRFIIDMKTDKE